MTATFVFNAVGCGFWLQFISKLFFSPFLNHSFGSDICFKYPASSPFCFPFLFLAFCVFFFLSCGFYFIFLPSLGPTGLSYNPATQFFPLTSALRSGGDRGTHFSRLQNVSCLNGAPELMGLLSPKPSHQILSGSPL